MKDMFGVAGLSWQYAVQNTHTFADNHGGQPQISDHALLLCLQSPCSMLMDVLLLFAII
jgi:hypothetical protein